MFGSGRLFGTWFGFEKLEVEFPNVLVGGVLEVVGREFSMVDVFLVNSCSSSSQSMHVRW